MTVDKGNLVQQLKALGSTLLWSVWILATAFAAFDLRGDMPLQLGYRKLIGDLLAASVLFVLFTIVYKANFEKGK